MITQRNRAPRPWLSVLLTLVACLAWPSAARAWGTPPPEAPEYEPSGPGGPGGPSVFDQAQGGDPNEARAESLSRAATKLQGLCASPKQTVLGVDDKNQSITAPEQWQTTCANYCGATAKIDVCAFSNNTLARVAFAVAFDDVIAILDELEPIYATAELLPADLSKRSPLGRTLGELANLIDQVRLAPDSGSFGVGELTANAGMDVLERLLGGLAKVIEDRAKREAVAWMLDEVGQRLCGLGLAPDQRRALVKLVGKQGEALADEQLVASAAKLLADGELSKPDDQALVRDLEHRLVIHGEINGHLLPNLCSLASSDRLDHYGAGAALLEALRGALEADVEGWPGVLAGLALAQLHWLAVKPETGPDLALLACSPHTPDPGDESCGEVERLRQAGERFVGRLLDHGDPLIALRELGTATSRETIRNDEIVDLPLALLSCGVSLPAELSYFSPRFVDAANPDYAALLAGLLHAPACWALVGEGFASVGLQDEAPIRAVANLQVERLSTIIRLHRHLGRQLDGTLVEVNALQTAVVELKSARKREYDSDEARVIAQWQAGRALIGASLSLADALLGITESLSKPSLALPSLARESAGAITLHAERARALGNELRALVDIVAQLATGDFGQALAVASTALLVEVEPLCPTSEGCRGRVDVVVRTTGTIAALLSAQNAEQVAEAIDAAANPPGGWRRKLAKGNLTVSLVAYPGTIGGAEFRWGPYGANYEQGLPVYAQGPTLSLPLGIDVVRGRGKWACGWFFSMIDPAAFLQYDLSNSGRLPGPRPVTVLAPGVFWRANLGSSPLIAMIGAVFRPQFRTWEPTVSGPGANALQVGIALGVDVTMWKLYARGR